MGEGGPYREVLQSIAHGVAIADPETGHIEFENARFFQWFPPPADGDDTLIIRMPALAGDRPATRLAERGRYQFESELKGSTPPATVRVEVTRLEIGGSERYLVEVQDISREKEVQYMLDSYSGLAERNARELQREKERVERLLLNIMPKAVFEELKDYGTTTPHRFDTASILMLDFVGFTDMAISQDPSSLVAELNDIFTQFDRIVEMFGCERLRTIGDAYVAVSGVPEPVPEHAHNLARVALRMRRYLERRNEAHTHSWLARIGINTGPVIGSLVGIQKYVYDLFGPGINLAARMETASEAMKITVSKATRDLIADEFLTVPRGEFEIKGFGTQELFFLEGEHG